MKWTFKGVKQPFKHGKRLNRNGVQGLEFKRAKQPFRKQCPQVRLPKQKYNKVFHKQRVSCNFKITQIKCRNSMNAFKIMLCSLNSGVKLRGKWSSNTVKTSIE